MITDDILFDRLWLRVAVGEPNECWDWQGATNRSGHGTISRTGRRAGMIGTHRVAYESVHGQIPAGMHVRHSCDRPQCCNPAHLLLGSHADNMRDMAKRGRSRTTQLTAQQVLEIRAAQGTTHAELAARFDVSKSNIGMIRSGRTWRHLDPKTVTA